MCEMFNQEQEKNLLLERRLNGNYMNLRMMNKGSETLDHLLSVGQPQKVHWGLGFKGAALKSQPSPVDVIKFVKITTLTLKVA